MSRIDFRKLAQRSPADLFLLAQTFFWLGTMRIAIAVFPFQSIAQWLGLIITETTSPVLETQISEVKCVEWAVRAASRRTPWESACLTQSLTGAILLQRRHIPGLLTLGITKDISGNGYSAHAWLNYGEIILIGAGGHERFQVIATFATC